MPEVDQPNSNAEETKNSNRNPFSAAYSAFKRLPIGLRRIVGGVAFCLLVVVVIAVFHPSLNERWKFGTDMGLNVLILFAIAVQAYIYRGQWEVMERTIEEAKISRELENRAYVTVIAVRLQAPLIEAVREGAVNVEVRFTNAGKTPALNARLFGVHGFSDIPHDVDFASNRYETSPGTGSSFIVFPGKRHTGLRELAFKFGVKEVFHDGREVAITPPRERLQSLVEQEIRRKFESGRLYVYGKMLYEDIFGKQWESTYCFFVPNLHDLKLRWCGNPKHNTLK